MPNQTTTVRYLRRTPSHPATMTTGWQAPAGRCGADTLGGEMRMAGLGYAAALLTYALVIRWMEGGL